MQQYLQIKLQEMQALALLMQEAERQAQQESDAANSSICGQQAHQGTSKWTQTAHECQRQLEVLSQAVTALQKEVSQQQALQRQPALEAQQRALQGADIWQRQQPVAQAQRTSEQHSSPQQSSVGGQREEKVDVQQYLQMKLQEMQALQLPMQEAERQAQQESDIANSSICGQHGQQGTSE